MPKMTKEKAELPRVFWLKLSANFFDQGTMLALEGMDNPERLQLIWIKLLLFCLKRAPRESEASFLRISDLIPCDENVLSKVLRVDIDSFRVAFRVFTDFEMIEILPDRTIFVPEIDNLIGSESSAADRKRRSRANVKRLKESPGEASKRLVTMSQKGVTLSQRPVTKSRHIEEVEVDQSRPDSSPPFEGEESEIVEKEEMDLQRKATEDLLEELKRRGLR